jgi:hypothetical protein
MAVNAPRPIRRLLAALLAVAGDERQEFFLPMRVHDGAFRGCLNAQPMDNRAPASKGPP